MTELNLQIKALIVAILIFEAANRILLDGRRPRPAVQVMGFLALALVATLGYRVFGANSAFLTCLGGLLLLNVVRLRLGLLTVGEFGIEPLRYVPAAAAYAFTGSIMVTVSLVVLLSISSRVLRPFLLWLSRRGIFRLSSLDVDCIAPRPVRYEQERTERGMTLLEVTVGLTLLVVISSAFFVASVQRSARLRQTREKAAVREAAVSTLERLSEVPFEELGKLDGRTFDVAGGGEKGRIRITFPEADLARLEVEAPRRGAGPIRLTTMRSGRQR